MLEDIMTRRVVTIEADANVTEAAIRMKEENVGCLVVVDKKQNLVGIVTDRDITIRVIGEKLDPNKTAVSQCMTKEIVTAISQMDILESAKVMNRYEVRRLPIVDGRSIVGIVSIADIAAYAESILGEVSKTRKR
jgi:CBS domain-containing protein